jgi:16S rRNA (guanine(966)-N(2))-methyltransferase RsmD
MLDVFAGTGAVGIEALSRGAAEVEFLDSSAAAVRTIRANLAATGLAAGARVAQCDAFAFLRQAPGPYDLVFVAPPQYRGLWRQALEALDARPELVAEEGVVVVQIDPSEEEPLELAQFEAFDRRRYGRVVLLFFGRRVE